METWLSSRKRWIGMISWLISTTTRSNMRSSQGSIVPCLRRQPILRPRSIPLRRETRWPTCSQSSSSSSRILSPWLITTTYSIKGWCSTAWQESKSLVIFLNSYVASGITQLTSHSRQWRGCATWASRTWHAHSP